MSPTPPNPDEPIESNPVNRNTDFLPKPAEAESDKVLYGAWRDHIVRGFEQNNLMFKHILDALMRPYWITVAMYTAMFIVGLGGFVAAIIFAASSGVLFSILFGGLSVGAFLAFFVSRPLRALEQNLLFITWLGVIYNTYWTRLMYTQKLETVQTDLNEIEDNAIAEINKLLDKQEKLSRRQPGQQVNNMQ